jgi:uncharacterized protein (DUF362 family)
VLIKRRGFIKNISAGAAGLAVGLSSGSDISAASDSKRSRSRIAFTTGTDRRDMIVQAMKPFENEIKEGIRGKQIVIKPNIVFHDNPLGVTHPDAVRGVLDFLRNLTDQEIIVGEGTTSPRGTMPIFEAEGYMALTREYNTRIVDLNQDSLSTLWITGENRHPLAVNIIDTYLNPNSYIISLPRMKTHDCVIATLAMKNVVMGAPVNLAGTKGNIERPKMHQGGVTGINYNIYHLAHTVYPDFSVIDGVVGMEGNGPIGGTPVEHGVVLAGTDAVAVDRIGIELMGIAYEDVGYLQWCSAAGLGIGDRDNITVIGPDTAAHVIEYKLHENVAKQYLWKESNTDDPRR